MMPSDSTMTKIVWQYSEPLPEETMTFLRGIAEDFEQSSNFLPNFSTMVSSMDRNSGWVSRESGTTLTTFETVVSLHRE